METGIPSFLSIHGVLEHNRHKFLGLLNTVRAQGSRKPLEGSQREEQAAELRRQVS